MARQQSNKATMVQTEGSLAIEAAKQRLAAAKAQKSAASMMVQSVAAALENAKKNEDLADSEVVKADAFLIEMEKRWEVIEIDDNDEIRSPSGGNKRQKITDDDAAGSGALVQTRTERANSTSTSSSSSTINDHHVKEVVVSGCTTAANANGTYTLCDEMRETDNAPVYYKPGVCGRTGRIVHTDFFFITSFYIKNTNPALFNWIIAGKTRKNVERVYTSDSSRAKSAPPKDGGWQYKDSSAEPNVKISYQ